MTVQHPTVELHEVRDRPDLETISLLVRDDPDASAVFGAFYGDATARLQPLLGPHRRVWMLRLGHDPVGFLDAELQEDDVALSYMVVAAHRRSGVARDGVRALIELAPWPGATYSISTDPANEASAGVARAAGFHHVGRNEFGDDVYRR